MHPLISIIVPVYNLENCIEYCVKSILKQTNSNFELILVNDGSTDDSLNICKKLAAKDSRICVLSKMNGGLSSARNTGLEHADGEWIAFIDGDDYIAKDYLERLLNGVRDEKIIMSMCGNARVRSYKDELPKMRSDMKYFQAKECAWRLLNGRFPVNAWGCLLKKACIGELKFDEKLRTQEDKPFELEFLLRNEDGIVAYTSDKLYGYLVRDGSITRSVWNGSLNRIKAADKIFGIINRMQPDWLAEAKNSCRAERFGTLKDIIKSDKSSAAEETYKRIKKEVLDMGYPRNGSRRLRVEYAALWCGDFAYKLLVKSYYVLVTDSWRYKLNERQTKQ